MEMSDDEWMRVGGLHLENWRKDISKSIPGYRLELSDNEASAFLYAWELAGREMGIVE